MTVKNTAVNIFVKDYFVFKLGSSETEDFKVG